MQRNNPEPGRSDPASPFAALLGRSAAAKEPQAAPPKDGNRGTNGKPPHEHAGEAAAGQGQETATNANVAVPADAAIEPMPAADVRVDVNTGQTTPIELPKAEAWPSAKPDAAIQIPAEVTAAASTVIAAPAVPQQPASAAMVPGIANNAAAQLEAPTPTDSAALSVVGKQGEAKSAEKSVHPQRLPNTEVEHGAKAKAEAGATATAGGSSMPAIGAPELASENGEPAAGHDPAPHLLRFAGATLHRHAGGTPATDPGAKPFADAGAQPPADAAAKPITHAQTSDPNATPSEADTGKPVKPDPAVRPQRSSAAANASDVEPRGSNGVRGPENALQTPGLTAHASQTAIMQVTAAATNGGHLQLTPLSPAAADAVPVPLAALAVEIAAGAHTGKHRFEIRLDPPELGRIEVRLDLDRDGHVTSRITVERVDTLDLLRRDSAQLERALQQAGLKTSDNALQFSLHQHAFARNENASENGTRLMLSDDDPAPLEAARHGYGRLLGLGGGLDIRV
jgi:flagellar hook-length control protein FliK